MILIELIQKAMREVISVSFWLITARDCNHCVYGYKSCQGYNHCSLLVAEEDLCLNSISRVLFKRKSKGGGENE